MDNTSTIILGISLMIIMWGMGLSLTPVDFKRIFQYPKAVVVGLVNQMILLPVIGFTLVNIFPVNPEIAVGVMILAACPGGATSNLITHLAKGDTALSVTLTAFSSFISVLFSVFNNKEFETAEKDRDESEYDVADLEALFKDKLEWDNLITN